MIDNIKYIEIALDEAKTGKSKGEIPVGVVIVENNNILYKGYNKKEELRCATRHAEIEGIEAVSKLKGDWHLDDCVMYVTMEPCLMCCGALIQSRIKKVYYLANNDKYGSVDELNIINETTKYNHQIEFIKIDDKNLESEYQKLLRDFFIDKR